MIRFVLSKLRLAALQGGVMGLGSRRTAVKARGQLGDCGCPLSWWQQGRWGRISYVKRYIVEGEWVGLTPCDRLGRNGEVDGDSVKKRCQDFSLRMDA